VIVIDYETFQRGLLPALQAAYGQPSSALNPALSELPVASVEAHVTVDHGAFPPDPSQAVKWSGSLRRVLERRAAGEIIVANNDAEPLTEASGDATSAKVIFFLLGIPGALAAAALGLAAASALTEAHRREDALLRTRGASDGQLVRLAVQQGLLAGAIGVVLGLAAAVLAVSSVIGHGAWRGIPTTRLAFIVVVAVAVGTVTTAARLVPLVRAARRPEMVVDRRLLPGPWTPGWRRAHLDVVAVGIGVALLATNLVFGGLKLPKLNPDQQAQTLAQSFYVLLAPIALWLGITLVAVRVILGALARRFRPDRARPLTSWSSAAFRWLARRPGRMAVTLSLGVLAVAFGVQVVTFTATYRAAKHADTRAAFGSDLRLVAATDVVQPLPTLGPGAASSTPIRYVPARAGSDRKTILAIDPATYGDTVRAKPRIVAGRGVDALAGDPAAVVVSQEIARDYEMSVGDTLPLTLFPDDQDLSQKVSLHVVGVFRSFPPDEPIAEMVIGAAGIPKPIPAADPFLVRIGPGHRVDEVEVALRRASDPPTYSVTTIADQLRKQQRSLTALNLDGLSKIEAVAATLIAAIGVGVLGAFLVLDRRREFAVLRIVGVDRRQLLTGPAIESGVAAVGSVLIGLPLGIGLAVLAVRVLGLFFTLPPPLVTLPVGNLLAIAVGVLAVSTIAMALSLRRVSRIDPAPLLREP
jgi:putative ABC transport system permease protein